MTSLANRKELKVVGTRPIRPDGVEKVTGRANFGADRAVPGMLYGRIKRSPHAHARILGIKADKALALPGVKAVVTAADFPEIRSEEAFVGEGPMNFRDLSHNIMARDKVLYEGHAVAAVAALSPIIAAEAVELIEVDYEVLPHVIDVEAAMAADAPLLHDDFFTQGVEPKPEKPSNIATRVTFAKGDVAARVPSGRCRRRAAIYDPAGSSGLYRAACLRRLGRLRRTGADLGQQPGPVHDPRVLREIAWHRYRQRPRHPGRDWRWVRRQDTGLSGAGCAGSVTQVWAAGQDRDDPGGCTRGWNSRPRSGGVGPLRGGVKAGHLRGCPFRVSEGTVGGVSGGGICGGSPVCAA